MPHEHLAVEGFSSVSEPHFMCRYSKRPREDEEEDVLPPPAPPPSKRARSRFRGVTQHLRTGRWEAHAWSGGRQHFLGSYDVEEGAARAYDVFSIAARGPRGLRNLPNENYATELAWHGNVWSFSACTSLGFAYRTGASSGCRITVIGPWTEC
jgi:hypothetical protein